MKQFSKIFAALFASSVALSAPSSAQEVEGAERALQTDAAIYAKLYNVSQAEAERRIQLMVLSRGALESEEAVEGDDLAASYFTHNGEFAFVIESRKGPKPKKLKTFKGSNGDLTLPVEVRQSAKPSRKILVRLLKDNKKSVLNIIPTTVELAYKEVEGTLWVVVDDAKSPKDLSAQISEIEKIFKVPVKIERVNVGSTLIAMPGGKITYSKDFVINGTQKYKNWCSTAFAATSQTGQLGMLTAGHCKSADGIFWSENGTSSFAPLAFDDKYSAWGDWALLTGVPIDKRFQANAGEFRNATGRRTQTSTEVRTTTKAGTFVCWYGGESGAQYGQQCGEVTSISAIGGDQGTCGNNTKVACEPIWIRVDPKAGQSYVYAGQGDSGSPVFAWNTAFGILTNSAHYFGSAQSLHVLYTSIDDVYSYSYALAY